MELSSTPSSSYSSSSSSSPSSSAPLKYDVFLSFRGEDTRYGFTGHLYDALIGKDLKAYRDDEKLRIGKLIRPELLQAIEESKSAIVILSENYADSTWCLDELAKIVECVKTRDLVLFPVFYNVDPSDVRKRRNNFDLAKYETNSEIAGKRIKSWRRALKKVGNTAGRHVKGDRSESEDIDVIVRKISQELEHTLPAGLDEEMRNLESLLRLLICRENDVERELRTGGFHCGSKMKREVVDSWLERMEMAKTGLKSLKHELRENGVYSFSYGQLGKRVKGLTEQVASLNQESNFPRRITLDPHEAKGVAFPTTDVVLGETFRANCEEVLEYLKNDQVSSIGIYGMGGVGKTTVMKHVHNQILVDLATFGDVCWITVSQNFSIHQLQHDISRKLNCFLPSEDDEMARATSLFDILKKKGKCILILDDVWGHVPLDKVGIPIGKSLCKLIVTTRSLDVCDKMECRQKIKIFPLSPEEAWKLFREKLGPHEEFMQDVKETAKDVARRCGGLPLAIITMAGSMRGVNDIHEWRNALEELKEQNTVTSNGIESKVLQVLDWSYNHLRDKESQLCFLSCALYPEDFEIPRHELIDYCIVKGHIRKRTSRQAEIAKGHTTLNQLERCFLLERVSGPFGERVKMHDLIREMALQIMSRKKQIMVKAGFHLMEIPEEEQWTKNLKVVSLIGTGIREIPDDWSPKCRKLSTLMLQQNVRLTRIPDSFFKRMCGLRVLNLRGNEDLRVLPDSVMDLINLNALWLGGCCNLEHIPSLKKLKELRDLELRNTRIKKAPAGFRKLTSLRCLHTDYRAIVNDLMELQQLEVFRGRVQDVSDYNILVRSEWFQRLWDYRLLVSSLEETKGWNYVADGGDGKEVVLEGLSLGGRGAAGVVEMPAGGIKRLSIIKCHDTGKCLSEFGLRWEDGRTAELNEINLSYCKEVEWVVAVPSSSTLSREITKSDIQLPGIENLYLADMENMKGLFNWWEYCDSRVNISTPSSTIPIRGGGSGGNNPSSFSRLKVLNIQRCHKMKVGLTMNCLVHLPMLENLSIYNCSEMEEIIGGGEDPHEYHNNIGISTNTDNNITLPNLKVVSLERLPSLRSIYNKGNIICDSIEKMVLLGCTKLKRLPFTTTTSSSTTGCCSGGSPLPPFPSLRKIYIDESEVEWWESLELVHPSYHSLLRPFLGLF